ncbi:MAG: class I SAM-dependent methyltransferase [Chloroflexota bacterium]|nr:MAG: class I SAM-dependent methyltransferase [Chloroflexota bacterium]
MSSKAITQQRDQFVERLLKSAAGVFDIFSMYLGDQLGYYRAFANGAAITSVELAAQTNTNERYTREWLEQQTVSGILRVQDETLLARERRYVLPRGHVEPLLERDSPNYLAPLAQLLVGVTRPMDELLNAYRNGGGVPYGAYGANLREGQAAINRPVFLYDLPNHWIPAMSDVHERLQAKDARIVDLGCGFGWSCVGMARAYPNVQVDGFDLDAPSIQRAKQIAQENAVHDRARFYVHDVSDADLMGRYDLVTAFECVHDMSNPVGALKTMKRLAGERGAVLIVDERVGDTFTAQGNNVEGMMYGWSVLHCLPVGMVEQPSAETGTVMRADTLREYARQAGFRRVEILPVENFFFRLYRLWT